MKIVYIAKFQRIEDEEIIAEALEANGVDVVRIDEGKYKTDEYIEMIKTFEPDYVMFAKLRTIEHPRVLLAKLKELGIKTISWTFDLLIGHPPREAVLDTMEFLKADYVFMTDGGREAQYKSKGINKKLVRQGIPEKFCYKLDRPKKYDIVFLGSSNPTFPYRQQTMEFLQKTYGDRFHWLGRNTSEYRGDKLNELVAETKIFIGDSMWGASYWSNRVYELVGRGAFLITPRVPDLEKEFEYYKEIVPYDYKDYEGLKEKIDYFLQHDKKREQIAEAGFKRVKKEYLYKHRVKQLLEML